ncbi:hypothetical protein DOA20_25870 [Salmonella enterica subsp. enterica serovar Newport]|nr:hypothetical protein [Salmonella enterica subsp. enterica serovar Newport]
MKNKAAYLMAALNMRNNHVPHFLLCANFSWFIISFLNQSVVLLSLPPVDWKIWRPGDDVKMTIAICRF